MLKYLIILLAVALALAPLSHFFPSKRQRLVARMREYAAVHGLFVEFRDIPARGDQQYVDRKPQAIFYGMRLPPSRGRARARLCWLPGDAGWTGLGHREPVPLDTAHLPGSVLALGMDENSCGIYWQEQGEEADVESIVALVRGWNESLSADGRHPQRNDAVQGSADDFP